MKIYRVAISYSYTSMEEWCNKFVKEENPLKICVAASDENVKHLETVLHVNRLIKVK